MGLQDGEGRRRMEIDDKSPARCFVERLDANVCLHVEHQAYIVMPMHVRSLAR